MKLRHDMLKGRTIVTDKTISTKTEKYIYTYTYRYTSYALPESSSSSISTNHISRLERESNNPASDFPLKLFKSVLKCVAKL